eukprot:Gb_02078 [translate_table: standard]
MVLPHRADKIEEQRHKSPTATFLEKNLERMWRVECCVCTLRYYRVHFS